MGGPFPWACSSQSPVGFPTEPSSYTAWLEQVGAALKPPLPWDSGESSSRKGGRGPDSGRGGKEGDSYLIQDFKEFWRVPLLVCWHQWVRRRGGGKEAGSCGYNMVWCSSTLLCQIWIHPWTWLTIFLCTYSVLMVPLTSFLSLYIVSLLLVWELQLFLSNSVAILHFSGLLNTSLLHSFFSTFSKL